MIEEPAWNQDFSEKLCAHCGKDIVPGREFECVCSDYGEGVHEESAWCSMDCMSLDHPDE